LARAWANAAAESFWATLKVEFYDPTVSLAAVRLATSVGSSSFSRFFQALLCPLPIL